MKIFFQYFGPWEEKVVNFNLSILDKGGSFKKLKLSEIVRQHVPQVLQLDFLHHAKVLEEQFPNGFQVWGLPSAARTVMSKVRKGDWFLFLARDPNVIEIKVVGKLLTDAPLFSSPEVSKSLWGGDSKFQLIFFLDCRSIRKIVWDDTSERFPQMNLPISVDWKKSYYNQRTHYRECESDFIDYLLAEQPKTESISDPRQSKASKIISEAATTNSSIAINEVMPKIENDQRVINLIHQYNEGFEKEIVTNKYERNPAAVCEAKAIQGDTCMVCGFNFGKTYGDHGKGFIEAHHLYPVSEGERHTNPATDISVLCSNCHRMIHRGDKILMVEELKEIIDQAKGNSGK